MRRTKIELNADNCRLAAMVVERDVKIKEMDFVDSLAKGIRGLCRVYCVGDGDYSRLAGLVLTAMERADDDTDEYGGFMGLVAIELKDKYMVEDYRTDVVEAG